jgi:hypothetical protein
VTPVPAGYSGTPLPKKLGITEAARLMVLGAPEGFDRTLGELPGGVEVVTTIRGRADVIVAFFDRRREFEARIERLERAIFPDGGLWIAWPKRSSGLPTDMGDDVVREVALPRGLVDNKVCAIDDTWSGLRVVWRREHRVV